MEWHPPCDCLEWTRVRFGYRRLRVLLQREGWDVGKERFYRVYTEEGLALRRKRPWRHATAVHREQRRPATARNDIWSMDFAADELAYGRRFRTLTVIDLFTRECLAIEVGQCLGGQDVAAALICVSLCPQLAMSAGFGSPVPAEGRVRNKTVACAVNYRSGRGRDGAHAVVTPRCIDDGCFSLSTKGFVVFRYSRHGCA